MGIWRQIQAGGENLLIALAEFFGLGEAAQDLVGVRDDSSKAAKLRAKLQAAVDQAIERAGYEKEKIYNSLYKLRNSPLQGKALQNAVKKAMSKADKRANDIMKSTIDAQAKISEIDRDIISGKPSQLNQYDPYWGTETTNEISKIIERTI